MSIKIGLALSGGGGCGFAHVGVLEVLIEHGINIDFVAGTSMGSIIGGMYASGLSLENMFEIIEDFKKNDIIDVNIFKIIRDGLISGNKLEKYLNDKLLNKNIEDFKIPFTAVAVDVLSGEEVLIKKGSGAFAMRASSAVPGVFSACPYNDKLLIDGGILNNLPYDVVKQMGADYVIAVDCLGDVLCDEPPKNVVESLLVSSNIMISRIMKDKAKKYDTLIKVNIFKDAKYAGIAKLNKKAVVEAIELGREAARSNINKILNDIKKLENN